MTPRRPFNASNKGRMVLNTAACSGGEKAETTEAKVTEKAADNKSGSGGYN